MGALIWIKTLLGVGLASTVSYFAFLGLLAIPIVQDQVVYLHKVTLTWFQDVNVPEQWGFLHNQVTPFRLKTPDGESLHAWHILPSGLYQQHEDQLIKEPSGLTLDIKARTSFRLLKDDPKALLVLYFHGAGGTLGSGYRPPSYRAIAAAASDRIHILAVDYRGYGTSTGYPSEHGLLTDALALVDFAVDEAGIPPSRIVLFGQSLGTAVTLALAQHLALRPDPALFAGIVLVAPMLDVELLTETYKIAGTVPLLGPLTPFPRLLSFFSSLIRCKWPSKYNIADLIRYYESADRAKTRGSTRDTSDKYHLTIIHAMDDYDIPWSHSEKLYWHAVNASVSEGISYAELEQQKAGARQDLGAGGWIVQHETAHGLLREVITKYGLHDRIMSHPVVSAAIWKAFQNELSPS